METESVDSVLVGIMIYVFFWKNLALNLNTKFFRGEAVDKRLIDLEKWFKGDYTKYLSCI